MEVERTPWHSYGVSLAIMGSHSVTCQSATPNTSEHTTPYPSQTGHYSIDLPPRDGRLSWPGWLVTYRDGLSPSSDGHPSKYTNRAQCQLTTLIEDNALTTTLRCQPSSFIAITYPQWWHGVLVLAVVLELIVLVLPWSTCSWRLCVYCMWTVAWNGDIGGILHPAKERNKASSGSDDGRLKCTGDGQPDTELLLVCVSWSSCITNRSSFMDITDPQLRMLRTRPITRSATFVWS